MKEMEARNAALASLSSRVGKADGAGLVRSGCGVEGAAVFRFFGFSTRASSYAYVPTAVGLRRRCLFLGFGFGAAFRLPGMSWGGGGVCGNATASATGGRVPVV